MAYLATPKLSYRKVVAALAESDERYRVLVEGVRRYAIFMLDPDGIIIAWNYGIYELLGYNREDILGHTGAMVFNAIDRAAGTFEKHLASARRSGESIREHLNVRKDGTELLVNETVTALRHSAGALLGYAKISRSCDVGTVSAHSASAVELAKALARIQGEVEQRGRLNAQLLAAIEVERERLGRDLNDDLSQRLVAITLMMSRLSKPGGAQNSADGENAKEISNLLTDALAVT
jgi:PAS domain S-box-containing protein